MAEELRRCGSGDVGEMKVVEFLGGRADVDGESDRLLRSVGSKSDITPFGGAERGEGIGGGNSKLVLCIRPANL